MDTTTLTEKTGHLAWCALVALQLARQDGVVISESQENLFLIRWLSTALKQHRFPREVASDINWLLKQGRTFGPNAKLRNKLNYLWFSCTGILSEQNDLFRLTYAIETAKEMSWVFRRLSDREWSGRNSLEINSGVNGIYLARSSLDISFDDEGRQIAPLMTKLTGNIAGIEAVFTRCGWRAEACQDMQTPSLFRLMVQS